MPKPFVQLKRMLRVLNLWKGNAIIFREVKYFSGSVAFAIAFTLLGAVCEGFGVGFILSFLQSLTRPEAAPIQTGWVWFDVSIMGVNLAAIDRLYRICLLILLTTACRLSFVYLGRYYSCLCSYKLAYQLRLRIFEQLQALSFSYFAKTRSGDLVNSATTEIISLTQTVNWLSVLITQSAIMCAYMISALLLSWQLTLTSFMLFSFLLVALSTLLSKIREASFDRTSAASQYASVMLEFINGIRTVQAFSAQRFERRKLKRAIGEILDAERKTITSQALVGPLSEGAVTLMMLGMLVLSFSVLIPNGHLQSASLLTFLFVLVRLIPVSNQVSNARAKLSALAGSMENIKNLLQQEDKHYLPDGHIPFPLLRSCIEFAAVDFSYDGVEPVLQEISFTIDKGKMTALVGGSGAGKSTLMDLLSRFYDPTSGHILLDGLDLREIQTNSLRQKVAIVSQDTFLFHASVRDNIAYALENVEEEAIWEVLHQAHALEFIQELPHGLDATLGDRGVRLSGGQRQRIAIARALLRDPDILILDEATSALDSVSERLIQESLEALTTGRTVIAIAHRLSTITQADKVIVLEQGRVVEQGKYQELLDKRGRLWTYHQMQHKTGLAS